MGRDTIFALASGAGRAAIAVLRVSAPATRRAVGSLAGLPPEPRFAALRDPAAHLSTDVAKIV
jgi:tRNA modification GTPase